LLPQETPERGLSDRFNARRSAGFKQIGRDGFANGEAA
jgi:hypothetical protein